MLLLSSSIPVTRTPPFFLTTSNVQKAGKESTAKEIHIHLAFGNLQHGMKTHPGATFVLRTDVKMTTPNPPFPLPPKKKHQKKRKGMGA